MVFCITIFDNSNNLFMGFETKKLNYIPIAKTLFVILFSLLIALFL